MAVKWTEEQQKVIDLRNRNILVSAAAGSGKTAVLVERILSMITDENHPIDIDSLLIVTFTRAAAAEMKDRIRIAIEKRLETEPENEHLQRQSTLIHNAQINTIDGFCSYVIRNYFHMINLDPGFRIADEGELRLLKRDVLKDVLEEAYEAKEPQFLEFVECYATGKDDSGLEEQILKLYEYSTSYPWPGQWLEECRKTYEISTLEEMKDSPWMKTIQSEADKMIQDGREEAEELLQICREEEGPYMYLEALEADYGVFQSLWDNRDYEDRYLLLKELSFARLSTKKDEKVSLKKRNQVKNQRQELKDLLTQLKDFYYPMCLEEVLESICLCRVSVNALIDLTLKFSAALGEKKREKNLLDFSDMEHFALDILVQQQDGNLVCSQAALELSERFEEIFIDEYQDSNLVQETILQAVSRKNRGIHNIFMVGDVKQSIYRFRQARPELFMEKYHSYSTGEGPDQRIDLHKNFRSRNQVLSGVNFMFYQIMGEELGKVEYDRDAALYPGASFPEGNHQSFETTELLLIEKDGEGLEDEKAQKTIRETEALAVAEKIRSIVGRELIFDGKTGQYRKASYGDIVILLRTISGWAESFSQVLMSQGIPAYTTSQTGYFSALEVVTLLNYLHILDNPRQDIPLGALLYSPIGRCDAQELAKIRSFHSQGDLYDSLSAYREEGDDQKLVKKLQLFWAQYEHLRKKVAYTPVHELILLILEETGYGDYAAAMPGGTQRKANLHMLVEKAMEYEKTSYRGLFNFIRYIEHLQKYDVDFGEVNISAGEDDVVQIMSIHKSKGLEFPVVFVSGLGKPFNQTDVHAGIVIHQDLGLGADCIDGKRRGKYPTVIKNVIKHQLKVESLGEEQRVLYVAMTRAKEKLILTGAVGNLENKIMNCLRLTQREEVKLPYLTLENASSCLDWVLASLARHPGFISLYESYDLIWNRHKPLMEEEPAMGIQVITPLELIRAQIETQVGNQITREAFDHWDFDQVFNETLRHQFADRFSYVYPYENMERIPAKVTVSQLKRQEAFREEEEYELYKEEKLIPLIPKFMEEAPTLVEGARKGTAYHRMLECLDLTGANSLEEIRSQKEALIRKGKLEKNVEKVLWDRDFLNFIQSGLGQRMAKAQKENRLYREQPFVLAKQASSVKTQWEGEEQILIQGIIDAYFLEEDGLVLVDYKTDRVKTPQELTGKYRAQLDYYGEALEQLTQKKVKEKIIYSFALGREILL